MLLLQCQERKASYIPKWSQSKYRSSQLFFSQYFNSKFIFSYMIASFFTEFPFEGISHPMIPWFLCPHPSSPRSKPKKASAGNDSYILEKNSKKSDTVINTYFCFTNKTTMEKDNRNSTKAWFSHLEYSQFHEKSKTVCLEIYIYIYIYIDNWLG